MDWKNNLIDSPSVQLFPSDLKILDRFLRYPAWGKGFIDKQFQEFLTFTNGMNLGPYTFLGYNTNISSPKALSLRDLNDDIWADSALFTHTHEVYVFALDKDKGGWALLRNLTSNDGNQCVAYFQDFRETPHSILASSFHIFLSHAVKIIDRQGILEEYVSLNFWQEKDEKLEEILQPKKLKQYFEKEWFISPPKKYLSMK